MLRVTENGIFCEAGGFHIDPWGRVDRAVITHSHADHARSGSQAYLTAAEGAAVLRFRLGDGAPVQGIAYGEPVTLDGVRVSLHPAGHVLGSAQVRIERGGEIWVVSGDYKLAPDPTCAAFEPVRCHTFVSESTFGLPIFRWRPQAETFAEIENWWRANQEKGRASLLFAYALGKAQRILAGVDASIGPIFTHGAVERINELYHAAGIKLPPTQRAVDARRADWSRALIVAPPSANSTPWTRRFGVLSTGFASGWMRIRGPRRRRSVDRGFVLSDHADWTGLLSAIESTGAERVWVTHGYRGAMVRWLREKGIEAEAVQTAFEGELDETGGGDPE
jgi:putative mRNA 3-end processing factor